MARKSVLDDHLDIVGMLPDKQVGDRAGVSAENVRVYRKRRGIAAEWRATSPASPKKAAKPRRRKSKLDKHRRSLGKLPDQVVAEKAGISLSAVRQYRYRHGIVLDREAIAAASLAPEPSPDQPKRKKRRKRRKSKIDRFRKVLGTVPDQQIAAEAGVSLSAVRAYRYKKGIKLTRGGIEATPQPPSSPAAAPDQQEPGPRWAYTITANVGETSSKYTVVAGDIVSAGSLAVARLAERNPGAVVQKIELHSEAL